MTVNTKRRYAWIDLETTGLDANKGFILEVVCIITDENLVELDEFNELIKIPLRVKLFPDRYMDQKVQQMHHDNALLEHCSDFGESLKTVYNQFFEFLEPYRNNVLTNDSLDSENYVKQELYFVGNSIGSLDLPFLRKHMPDVMELVHYRSIDITGLRLGLELMLNRPNDFYFKSQVDSNHRALDDVKRCIEQLKFYQQLLGVTNAKNNN